MTELYWILGYCVIVIITTRIAYEVFWSCSSYSKEDSKKNGFLIGLFFPISLPLLAAGVVLYGISILMFGKD